MWKKIWDWLNGKKTIISVIYGAVITYLGVSNILGPNELVLLSTIGGALFGVGIGHKIGKSEAKRAKAMTNDVG